MPTELTVPPEYQPSFRREALFALESAAGTLEDVAGFVRRGNRNEEVDLPLSVARFDATRAMYDQVQAGEFSFTADDELMASVLESACTGCMIEAVDRAKGGAEEVDHSKVIPCLDEAKFWHDQLDHQPAATVMA
jgi:hypothetical protein